MTGPAPDPCAALQAVFEIFVYGVEGEISEDVARGSVTNEKFSQSQNLLRKVFLEEVLFPAGWGSSVTSAHSS